MIWGGGMGIKKEVGFLGFGVWSSRKWLSRCEILSDQEGSNNFLKPPRPQSSLPGGEVGGERYNFLSVNRAWGIYLFIHLPHQGI